MADEKWLIDANAFLAYIEKQYCKPCKANGQDYHEIRCRACWVDDMQCELDGIPTVDAVEVIRCRDCQWYAPNHDGSWIGCAFDTRNPDDEPKPDDFCSYGERRNDGKSTSA